MSNSRTSTEISSQPDCWRRVLASPGSEWLPRPGERIAVVGCGTSWFMAQAYASAREAGGHGVTDAYTATELPTGRTFDRLLAITRSGTTTEIVDVVRNATMPVTVITAVAGTPAPAAADHVVVLDFADETSVVQTRFATTALVALLHGLGTDLSSSVADAEKALLLEIPQAWIDAPQISFLGTGWTIGLAHEAALKLREASQSWTESYVAMEYRHGPIAIAEPGRLVWLFGPAPAGLAEDVAATGATFVDLNLEPLAELVLAQRLGVARAEARGLNPDSPRSLSRSVILSA